MHLVTPVITRISPPSRARLGVVSLALTMIFAGAVAACSDDGATSLLGARGGTGGGSGTQPGGDGTGGGTTAGGATGDGGTGPVTIKARAAFDAIYPTLASSCGTCHDTGLAGAPKFLEKSDAYGAITKYKGIVVKDYFNSRLLVVGSTTGHSGGAGLTGALRDGATAWLALEAAALADVVAPSTDAFDVAMGANSVDISKGGTGVTGAKLNFTAALAGTSLIMTNLQVSAPAASGLQVTAPKFIIVAGTKETPDPVDSFSNLDQSVGAGQTATMGPGTLLLTGFATGNKLRIEFVGLKASTAVADAGTGGCKSVATFTSSAAPQLQSLCVSCHGGGNAGATGAMDLSALANDKAKACAQALNKVNTANKAQSAIIVRPRPGSGHPGVNNFDQGTHDAAMLGWINNE